MNSQHRSAQVSSRYSPAEFSQEPQLGQPPVTQDRVGGNLQHFSRFLHSQPSEETHLHNLAFSRVHLSQSFQGLIQSQQILISPRVSIRASSSVTR